MLSVAQPRLKPNYSESLYITLERLEKKGFLRLRTGGRFGGTPLAACVQVRTDRCECVATGPSDVGLHPVRTECLVRTTQLEMTILFDIYMPVLQELPGCSNDCPSSSMNIRALWLSTAERIAARTPGSMISPER